MTEQKFLSFMVNIIEIISVRVRGTRETESTVTVSARRKSVLMSRGQQRKMPAVASFSYQSSRNLVCG